MAKSEFAGTDWPETAADALEALEILRRAYVPKNTSDAKYCLAALNVLRRDLPYAQPNVTGLADAAVEKLMEWPSGAMSNTELFDMTYRVRQVADAAFKAGSAASGVTEADRLGCRLPNANDPDDYSITIGLAEPAASGVEVDARTCTCHPDDNPPKPCPRKFALNECRAAAGVRVDAPSALVDSLILQLTGRAASAEQQRSVVRAVLAAHGVLVDRPNDPHDDLTPGADPTDRGCKERECYGCASPTTCAKRYGRPDALGVTVVDGEGFDLPHVDGEKK